MLSTFLSYFPIICLSSTPLLSSEEQSRLAARKYARVVQKLGFPAKFLDFKIQNMVGSCDVKFPIRLEGLVLTHQQFSRSVCFISCFVLCGESHVHFCFFQTTSVWCLHCENLMFVPQKERTDLWFILVEELCSDGGLWRKVSWKHICGIV